MTQGEFFNAVYGPFLAYIGGFLLLLVHNWFNFQILTVFTVLLIAGIGMYRLALKANVDEVIAILLALIYLQFGIVAGILRFNFMAWGAALAPYAMMQVLYMINDERKPTHWLSLALIMSLIAQVHLLSTVYIACTFVPFAIYALVKTSAKKQMIIDFFKALGTTLVLTFSQNLSVNYAINRQRTLEFLDPNYVVIIQRYSKITKHRRKLQHILRYTNNDSLFKAGNHTEPDYLPYTKHASNVTYQKKILDQAKHYHYHVKGNKLFLTWNSKKAKMKMLPIVMYHQSRLTLNGKLQTKLKQNTITQPIVKAKKGRNIASLQFITPIWFKALLLISILGWFVLFGYGI
ncbi:hypothetical protein E0700_04980 [Lactobacillus helveticus]|nr:hypothetical protein [Lactobacillus helveticus]